MKRGGFLKRYTPIKRKSTSESAVAKESIQALLRAIVIIVDGGCVLRHYPVAGPCSGWNSNGDLILQAEHLVTRGNSISYGDLRNIVCLCRDHHLSFKPTSGRLYWELIEGYVGAERWKWIKAVEAEERAHKPSRFTAYEWQKIEMYLRSELQKLQATADDRERALP